MNDKQNIENQNSNFDMQASNASQGKTLSGESGEHASNLSLSHSIDIDTILSSAPIISAAHLKEGILKNIGLNDAAIKAQALRNNLIKYGAAALVLLFVGFMSVQYWSADTSESNENKAQVQASVNSQEQASSPENMLTSDNQQPAVTNQNIQKKNISTLPTQRLIRTASEVQIEKKRQNENADNKYIEAEPNEVLQQYYDFASNINAVNYNTIQSANIANGTTPKYEPMQPVYVKSLYSFLNNFDMQLNWYGLNYNYPNSTSIVSNTLLTDFSIALLYNISENDAVGIMAGNDFFMLQYEGWEGKEKFEYNQQLQTLWFGATYKHEFATQITIAHHYDVIPYAQLGVAYANVGIYSQLNAGLKMKLDDKSALTLGFTSGALLYQYDICWASSKAGLNIGFMFGL